MAISPLDYILQGARKILDKGQDAFRDDSNLGIAKNTVLGLPQATRDVLFPTRGFTETQLKQAKPTIKDVSLSIPRLGAEFSSAIGGMLGQSGTSRASQFAQTKVGGKLADVGQKITDFSIPKTPEQAKAMRVADIATMFPVGSTKVTATGASAIAKTRNLGKIKTILKTEIPKLSDEATEAFGRVLVGVDNVDDVQRVINRTKFQLQKATPVADDLTTNVKAIMETGKPMPVYKETGDLSLKTLKKLEGRSTVSKQFISDMTNSPDLKQSERDVIRQVLNTEGDVVDVTKFANKVKGELLPLNVKSSDLYSPNPKYGEGIIQEGSFTPKYDGFSLPDEIRGKVANYKENIYESPIATSAGDTHFAYTTKNYFGHTRIEDMADNKTRRVIEVQSDLYQKGNLEGEEGFKAIELGKQLTREDKEILTKVAREAKTMREFFDNVPGDSFTGLRKLPQVSDEALYNFAKEGFPEKASIQKLQQYNDPTAHFRMVREEIKKAAQDGKTKLQFPTGETAMKIEGLGTQDHWQTMGRQGSQPLDIVDLKVGMEAWPGGQASNDTWIITDVLGDGKFKAVPKYHIDNFPKKEAGWSEAHMQNAKKELESYTETFDISGKVDTNNPIYRFYEKDLGRYLNSKYKAKTVKDKQGVSWYEIDIDPKWANIPTDAFGAVAGIEQDEEGNIRFNATKAGLGILGMGGLRKVGKIKTNKGLPALTKKTPITLPSKAPVASKVGSEASLLQEARKYKSAEEFVKAQLLKEKDYSQVSGGATFFEKYPDVYTKTKQVINPKGEGVLADIHDLDAFKIKDFVAREGFANRPKIITDDNGNTFAYLKTPFDKIGKKAKYELSRDNVFITEDNGKTFFSSKEFDTKSQLIDIWNKAQEGVKPESEAILPKKVTEVDRLIASGDIRVKSVNGTDVYQYKKGNEWVNARNEDSAVAQVTKPKVSKAVQLPEELVYKKIDIDLREQELKENPLNNLVKYSAKRGDMKGRLPEVLGEGKSKFGRKGDQIVTEELSNLDITSEEARDAFEDFMTRKEALIKDKEIVKAEEKAFRQEAKLVQQKKGVKLPPPSQVVSPKTAKPSLSPLSTGEERTLEKLAQQQSAKASQESGIEVSSLPKIIQQQTPVSNKVGLLDYIRTPENVLKKIGLENESKLIRDSYEAYTKELPTNIQKITDWSKRVSPESNKRIFRYLDNQAIDLNPTEIKVAGEIKSWLAEWADRLGLPNDNRIAEYITHIFDDQLIKKEFDEDLAKIIADKIPSSVYNPFLQKRLGAKGYIEDTWKALDAYAKRATRKVHMDKALERLEAVSEGLEESQWKYIKRYADRINMRPTEMDNLVDNQLKQVIGYKLGQRPVANISRVLRQTTFRGMLGANLGSALRNLTQGVNTYAKLGEKYTALGYKDLLIKGIKELKDEGILADNLVQDRSINATKKAIEKLDKGLFFFFDTAEKINRGSAYYGAKAKALSLGKTEREAIDYAKKIVRDTQFQYGAIDTPVAMNSDIVKVLTQFMTYPVKQTEFLAGMAKNKEYMGIARYVLGGLAVVYSIGQVLGMKPTEMIPFFDYVSGERKFGVPPSLKFPVELFKAGIGTKDKFGQERDLNKKLKDVAIAGAGLIPGGIQAKKALEGSKMVTEGGSFDKSGKLQFKQGESTASKLQSVLFGKYAGKEARDYFDKGMKAKAVIKTEKELAQEVLAKLKSGEFGSEAVAEEYLNSELKKIDKAKKEERLALPPKEYAQELLNQIKSGKLDEATAEKELNTYLNQPEIADRTTKYVQERGTIGLILDYGKALTIDPSNAFKAMTPKAKLGIVEGNLVEMQRFDLIKYDEKGGSDEYKKKAMQKLGIPLSDIKKYKLEHIVPVKAGGDSTANNLLIVTNDEHNSYTRFDTKASKMVQDKQTTRRKVAEIAIKLKIDKTISVEQALRNLGDGSDFSSSYSMGTKELGQSTPKENKKRTISLLSDIVNGASFVPGSKLKAIFSGTKAVRDIINIIGLPSSWSNNLTKEALNTYPFSDEARKELAKVTTKMNREEDTNLNASYERSGADVYKFLTYFGVSGKTASSLADTGLAQRFDSPTIKLSANSKNVTAMVASHEMLHHLFYKKIDKNGSGFYDSFNQTFENLAKSDKWLEGIDNHIKGGEVYQNIPDLTVANERFAYIGEHAINKGWRAIPPELRKYYVGIIRNSELDKE